jgi:TonB family protein
MIRIRTMMTIALVPTLAAAQGPPAQSPPPRDTLFRICRPTLPAKCYPPLGRDTTRPLPAEPDQPWFEFMVDEPVTERPDTQRPQYPPTLREARVQGSVTAQFVVDTLGRVEVQTFKILSASHPLFEQAVREALPGMRFTAAIARNRKVRQLAQMPFVFSLAPR